MSKPGFEDLQQIQTCQTAALVGDFIVAAELTFQNAVYAAGALLGTQLAQIVRLATRAVSTTAAACAAMLTRSKVAAFNGALRV